MNFLNFKNKIIIEDVKKFQFPVTGQPILKPLRHSELVSESHNYEMLKQVQHDVRRIIVPDLFQFPSKIEFFRTLFLILFCLFLAKTLPSWAFPVQKINLEQNQTYMVIFDESVENYTLNGNNSIKIELLNNLFNDKTEMLLTPLNQNPSSLTIVTRDNTYQLDISVQQDKENSTTVQNIPDKIAEDNSIDLPPMVQNDSLFSFSLDTPPEMR